VQNLGIPRENIYSSRDTDFVSGILRSTSGAGVDVVFNSLTGKMLHASWDLCADFGRFIDVSLRDSLDGGRLHMRPFSRGVMYRAFNLSDIYYANNHERKAFFHK
jgi:NADPH:quinone reductase-like Zn-dependent oxidoreductase